MPTGIRRDVYAQKERMRKIYLIVTVLVLVLIVAVISYYLVTNFFAQPNSANNNTITPDCSLRAALVDALYFTIPNDQFTGSLQQTLVNSGFEVDVFQGSDVTVDFLKNLQSGYDLIVFRMHSALHNNDLYLFTGEPYSASKYTDEQYFQLVKEAYATDDSNPVFAVNWGFIRRCMTGKFNDTLVVVMGCDGTRDSMLIDEFFNQGAAGFISWDGRVLVSHSDSATLQLVKYLYLDGLSVRDATQKTNKLLGPDPNWDSILEYYIP
ncbi:MAG: hypothetical protein WC325_03130 [Candidatus Bathyarchaeia archaeon]|jgi:hypothetical protein